MLWRSNNRFTPPVDVIELSDQIIILVEVAGMKPDDFKISLVNRRLLISGVRHRPDFEITAHHRVEIGYGEFRIDIPLPWSVQNDTVSAAYQEGFLKIALPRRAERQIRIVNIENTQDEESDDK